MVGTVKKWVNALFRIGAAVCTALVASWSQQPSLIWLDTLGGARSEAHAVSADGRVVVGEAYYASGRIRAFRWTAHGGMRNLGTLGGRESVAYGISADGRVVVGGANNSIGLFTAFRWT